MQVSSWPMWRDVLPPNRSGLRRGEGGRRLSTARGSSLTIDANQPLVSYVTVVRNASSTFQRTLESVRNQQWPRVEHIVVDGLSDDGTWELLQEYGEHIDYFVSEPDHGLYDALNKAIPLARGELICVLNADDWLTPDAAATVARLHQAQGKARSRLLMTAAWVDMPDGQRLLWKPQRVDAGAWFTLANVCHNGIYATPGAYEDSGPYAINLRIAADTRWVMGCVDYGVETSAYDHPTLHYSLGGLSGDTQRHTLECLGMIRERFPFLDESEAWALWHAYFQLRERLPAFAATRPPHLKTRLHEIARRHSMHGDLMTAMNLAGLTIMKHPDDEVVKQPMSLRDRLAEQARWRWLQLRNSVFR